MTHDARGVPVSSADRTALDLYEQALGQYQSYVGDPVATIEEAVTAARRTSSSATHSGRRC